MRAWAARRRRVPRPRWSLRTSFFFLVAAAAFVYLMTLLVLQRSLWVELDIATAVVALFLYGYFVVLLHLGVRIDQRERLRFGWWSLPSRMLDAPFGGDLGLTYTLAEAGVWGCVLGLVLDLVLSFVLSIVLALVVWLGVNLVLETVVVVCLPLFILFRRSVRVALVRGRRCRGKLGSSLRWAAVWTALSAAWLYLVLFTAHALAARLHHG